jgi:hypothetical protein
MLEVKDITRLSEPDINYVKALKKVKTLQELKDHVRYYKLLAEDAYILTQDMTEADFIDFIKGARKEWSRNYAGDEYAQKYGIILLPFPMLRFTLLKCKLNVPFGLIFQRALDTKIITIENNTIIIHEKDDNDNSNIK